MTHKNFIQICLLLTPILLTACSSTLPKKHTRVTIHHPGTPELIYSSHVEGLPGYVKAVVNGRDIVVTGDVVRPSAQSVYLLSHWEIKPGETVLDMGTGSGVQAIFAADNASRILATDINPLAVGVARYNVGQHKLAKKIEVRQSDLFKSIREDEKFDVILFNIDYPYNQEAQGLWKLHERFFANVRTHLKPGGRIYYQSGLLGNINPINKMVRNNELRIVSLRMDAALRVAREPIVYLIMRNIDL